MLLVTEAAVYVHTSDEYDKASTVGISAKPVGQVGPVEQEAVNCEEPVGLPDDITEEMQVLPSANEDIAPGTLAYI